jgi:hypothetical protein
MATSPPDCHCKNIKFFQYVPATALETVAYEIHNRRQNSAADRIAPVKIEHLQNYAETARLLGINDPVSVDPATPHHFPCGKNFVIPAASANIEFRMRISKLL